MWGDWGHLICSLGSCILVPRSRGNRGIFFSTTMRAPVRLPFFATCGWKRLSKFRTWRNKRAWSRVLPWRTFLGSLLGINCLWIQRNRNSKGIPLLWLLYALVELESSTFRNKRKSEMKDLFVFVLKVIYCGETVTAPLTGNKRDRLVPSCHVLNMSDDSWSNHFLCFLPCLIPVYPAQAPFPLHYHCRAIAASGCVVWAVVRVQDSRWLETRQVVLKIKTTEEDYTGPYHNMWKLGLVHGNSAHRIRFFQHLSKHLSKLIQKDDVATLKHWSCSYGGVWVNCSSQLPPNRSKQPNGSLRNKLTRFQSWSLIKDSGGTSTWGPALLQHYWSDSEWFRGYLRKMFYVFLRLVLCETFITELISSQTSTNTHEHALDCLQAAKLREMGAVLNFHCRSLKEEGSLMGSSIHLWYWKVVRAFLVSTYKNIYTTGACMPSSTRVSFFHVLKGSF